MKVKLEGRHHNYYGVGATVIAKIKGEKPMMRLVTSGSNYFSQDDTTLTFGLGRHKQVDELEIRWPGKRSQIIKGPFKAGKTILVKEDNTPLALPGTRVEY